MKIQPPDRPKLVLKIGKDIIPSRMPSMLMLQKLILEQYGAMGYAKLEEGDDIDEDLIDGEDLLAVYSGTIGACWAGSPLKCLSFRQCDKNILDYGDGVYTELELMGYLPEDIRVAGQSLFLELRKFFIELSRRRQEVRENFSTGQEDLKTSEKS